MPLACLQVICVSFRKAALLSVTASTMHWHQCNPSLTQDSTGCICVLDWLHSTSMKSSPWMLTDGRTWRLEADEVLGN